VTLRTHEHLTRRRWVPWWALASGCQHCCLPGGCGGGRARVRDASSKMHCIVAKALASDDSFVGLAHTHSRTSCWTAADPKEASAICPLAYDTRLHLYTVSESVTVR
jgi:hypothetical protein